MFEYLPKVPLQTAPTAFKNPHTIQQPEIPKPTRSLFSPLKLVDACSGVIQRTIYKFTGGKWEPYCDKKNQPDNPAPTHTGAEGDFYDAAEGKQLTASEVLRGRMLRANERWEKRIADEIAYRNYSEIYANESLNDRHVKSKSRTSDTSIPVENPFSTAYVVAAPFAWGPGDFYRKEKQPYVLDKKNTLSNYTYLSKIVDEITDPQLKVRIFEAMLGFMKSPVTKPPIFESKDLTEKQRDGLSLLCAIITVAETHKTRFPDGGKSARAAVRYAQKHSVNEVFDQQHGLFLQSLKEGNKKNRGFLFDDEDSYGMEALLEDMSDSSGDETDNKLDLVAPEKTPAPTIMDKSGSGSESDLDESFNESDSPMSIPRKGRKLEQRKTPAPTVTIVPDSDDELFSESDSPMSIPRKGRKLEQRKIPAPTLMNESGSESDLDESFNESDFLTLKPRKRRRIEQRKTPAPTLMDKSDSDLDDELFSDSDLMPIKRMKLSEPDETNE